MTKFTILVREIRNHDVTLTIPYDIFPLPPSEAQRIFSKFRKLLISEAIYILRINH